jgi:peptidyl-prolyl cis-trans isomerase SurA
MRPSMRFLPALLALAVGALPAAAQPARSVEVDRIVAVVGTHPVLFSEVLERINFARANGLAVPPDSAGQMALARQVLGTIVDEQVLIAVAKDYKIEVSDADVTAAVEQRLDRIRGQFQSEEQFRAALAREGFGNFEAFRRQSLDQAKNEEMQTRARDSLRVNGRLAPVNVTEAEVAAAFDRVKQELPARPATVGFRQIIVAPQPRMESRLAARMRIDSVRVRLEAGADFDSLARAVSQDGTASQGGDLGWNRRGDMVPEFDRMMFALQPGRISPVVETQYGYHVMRVDRVRAGEVRARHILVKPAVDSADGAVARARADTVLALWREGVTFDSLVKRFHDPDEERSVPSYPRDTLPAEYRTALEGVADGSFTPIFLLPNPVTGVPKAVVLQLTESKPAGAYTLEEYQERLRQQLRQEKSLRRTLDNLRREYYVSLRL